MSSAEIDSQFVLYSSGKNDECMTPAYGVEPILPYIPKGAIVWCPFDKKDSNYVKLIRKQNKVVHSHIDNKKDFYKYEPKEWDVIVSNPPFTNKRGIFERAISFKKPFALLMTNTWLNDSAPKILFENVRLELMMFDRRIEFEGIPEEQRKKITFSSSYYCHKMLKKQIVMKRLNRE